MALKWHSLAPLDPLGAIHDCVFYGNLFIKSADIPTISPPALSEKTLKQMCHQDHSEVYECECETCDGGR